RRIWGLSWDGRYSVRTAYRQGSCVLRARPWLDVSGNCKSIWQMQAPPKIRHHTWRVARQVLPTKVNLARRGVAISVECGLCAGEAKTGWHLFTSCPVARRCWELVGLDGLVEHALNPEANIQSWIFEILSTATDTQRKIFGGTLWSLWKERNDRDWASLHRIREPGAGERPSRGCCKWHPPAGNSTVKINFDAATFVDSRCHGVGMVARSQSGGLIAFKQELLQGTPPARECEAHAFHMAIRWAVELGIQEVDFESDCQE
ncbi:Putative ribonuclease H protein At1g65750, partial [Linum perenne]